jgi:hypothetical protein
MCQTAVGSARCYFEPSTFLNLCKLAHSQTMVDKGDNFPLHQRTLKASGGNALEARSISATNNKGPSGELNFPIYYCAFRLGTTFVLGAGSGFARQLPLKRESTEILARHFGQRQCRR